ncbi:hypothetical protein [Polynucleobacter sp.]|uniref:hypothetical protein n=1 Tax=Polynucleobacter sp. TaxID=2029855 RepID=UPI003F69685B
MTLNTQLANATVNGQADNLSARLNSGYLRIYDGTQPATADTSIGAQVLLAELTFSATAAPAAVNGLITFNALTADSSANATGTPTWFRAVQSNGTTVVMDGSVGASGCNLNLSGLTGGQIIIGGTVSISSFTHDVLNASAGL